MIEASCECGRRFRASDKLAGREVMCPSCGAEVAVPVLIQPTPPPEKRPLWKDPVVVIGAAIPTAILVAFFAYLYYPCDLHNNKAALIFNKDD